MRRNILRATFLSLAIFHSTFAGQSVVDLALEGVGAGSAEEMKSRIFGLPITVLGRKHRHQATQSLQTSIRESRITAGRLWQRVQRVAGPVLELHQREQMVEIFLYRDPLPRGAVWMGCLLLLSDSLVASLTDAELAGIVGHELAHAYFMDEIIAAERAGDDRLKKVVELKCDATAMLTLKLLGSDPRAHLKAVKKILLLLRGAGLTVLDYKSHPDITERALFSERFRKLLAQ